MSAYSQLSQNPEYSGLPVVPVVPELSEALAGRRNAVLCAPPGSGKTTAVPLALLCSPWLAGQRILMLEPRRLAARAAARRMASLLDERVGATVGYQVRFDRRVGPDTRIEVLTEGILTRRLQADPSLPGVGLVIFDEFHERSLHADLALALCLDARAAWSESLAVLVMSATLDARPVSALLGDAPIIKASGRQYPVKVEYLGSRGSRPETVQPGAVVSAARRALRRQQRDVLVFLPGAREIQAVSDVLQSTEEEGEVRPLVCPLYGELSAERQDQAILSDPGGRRRVVLATNIAETSLTIEGVGAVVDSGLARKPYFDPNTAMSRLRTVTVSQASSDQRTGRAGRLGPGICLRLWSESEQRQRPEYEAPEIASADLCPLMLELAAWGVTDFSQLPWMTSPPKGSIAQAVDLLRALEAVDAQGRITPTGRAMAKLAAHPRLARVLLTPEHDSQRALACELAAILESPDVINRNHAEGADLVNRLEVLHRWRQDGKRAGAHVNQRACRAAQRAMEQFARQLKLSRQATGDIQETGRLLLAGYPDRLGRRRDGSRSHYRFSAGSAGHLADGDALGNYEFVVAPEIRGTHKTGFIALAAGLDDETVTEFAATHGRDEVAVGWNAQEDAVEARVRRTVGVLELSDRPAGHVTVEDLDAAMLEGIRQMGLEALPWSVEMLDLCNRIECLTAWLPDEQWPAVDTNSLLDNLPDWLGPFLCGARRRTHLGRIDLGSAMHALIPYAIRSRVDELAPTHYTVPSGSRIKISYVAGESPVLAVKLQEMFGTATTPAICNGKVPLTIHLLSPAGRPLQITQDLAAFWQSAYQQVRKEMRGRYPKHPWPEHPQTAQPTRFTKRALAARSGK